MSGLGLSSHAEASYVLNIGFTHICHGYSFCRKLYEIRSSLTAGSTTHSYFLVYDLLKKSFAAFLDIPPGHIEISRVPRIGYIAGAVCKVHQQMHLVCKIATADSIHTSQVGTIHANQ